MIRKSNKKTKIIATLGPSTYNSKIIKSLIINGVNVFRLNFSHGTYKEHSLLIDNINKASKQLKLYPCILADLQGPKIRTGNTINNEMINITKNKEITITTKNVPSTDSIVSIQYPNLIDELSISQDIY
ncbi:MAG: pyruvate kinase, partial [Nanoarchaeota archaeon]|nr:pyruvate kinase [Nanoarchaeota archaeon]